MTVEDYVLIVIQAFGDAVNTLVCVLGVIIFNMETPQEDTPQKNTPQEDTPQKNIPQENIPQKNIPQENTPQKSVVIKINN
jgi:hypothetical protein